MRRTHQFVIAFTLTFAQSSVAQDSKVLVIGIDGLRPDAIEPADTPHLDALIADGTLTLDAQVGPVTVSGPGWSNMLTGVWADRHGVTNNTFAGSNYAAWPDFLTRIERERPHLRTAAFVSWLPLANEMFDGLDVEGAWTYTANGDRLVRDAAVLELSVEDPDAMFVYFADLDVEGHATGFTPTNIAYLTELEQIDGYIGELLSAMRGRATYAQEDWLILVSSTMAESVWVTRADSPSNGRSPSWRAARARRRASGSRRQE